MSTAVATDAAQRALREGCALVDRSEQGKLALTGSEAKGFLSGQVTNDVEALEAGRGQYAALLTHKGKMLGDLRVLDTGAELLVLCERVALQALFDTLRRAILGHDAQLHKRTLQRGLLALIGPRARAVAGAGDLPDEEHANRPAQVAGADVLLVATDAGVDVVTPAEDTHRVREALLAAGAEAVEEADAEVLRVERGRPRYGVDLDDTVIPQEAGLNERAISFTKGCYVGQETVARLFYRGKPNRHLRGLRLSTPVQPGEELRLGGKTVGRVTSVADSPVHGSIALGFVRRETSPGDTVTVGEGPATAQVVELPF
ncbi:MAG TPA: glycine cleavage T C-terminal barrel domain-containing protein [Solirubrobacteraceae bacterium]|nr:glycine cleavage T C-terminal barrel domain-containing protein [Solirubrobacteraceae bacterium]